MGTEIDGVNGIIKNTTSDGDITIKGNDDGSEISAVIFDMSDAGTATFNHDIKLSDSGVLRLGDDADAEIFHDGSGTVIREASSGNLVLAGNDVQITNGARNETHIDCNNNGSVDLYHNNVKKLETSSTGINLPVDGDSIKFGADSEIALTHVHSTGLSINSGAGSNTLQIQSTDGGNSAGPILNFYRNSASPADGDILGKLNFTGNDAGGSTHSYGTIEMECNGVVNGQEQGKFIFKVSMPDGALANTLRLDRVEAVFNEDSEDLDFRVESNNQTHMFFIDGGAEFVSTGDTAPDVSRLGLCLNQAGNDGNILSFKSSDVAHGVTDLAETDTWFAIKKFGANDGAAFITSFAGGSSNCALYYDAVAGSEDTGKGTGDHGCINLDAQKDNGTDKAPLASNGNLLTVSNDNSVRFIVDAEGDIHVDGSSSISTYDTYEDAHLVRAYDLSYGQTSKGLINSKFDKFINYNHDSLVEAGIIGVPNKKKNEDGTETYGLLNSTAMQRLHNGAIWQQYEKHQKLASAFYKLAEKTIGKEEADKLLTEEEIQLLN